MFIPSTVELELKYFCIVANHKIQYWGRTLKKYKIEKQLKNQEKSKIDEIDMKENVKIRNKIKAEQKGIITCCS